MTKSSPKKPAPPVPAAKTRAKGFSVVSFIFRLLLLGVGSGFAWLLGIAAAQFYPSGSAEIPIAEKVLRQAQSLTSGTKRLPSPPPPPSLTPTPSPSQSQLNPTQREKLQADLRQLQGDLNQLIGRTAILESQLGSSHPTESLEKRLQLMSQQLAATDATTATSPSPPLPTVGASPVANSAPQNDNSATAEGNPIFSTDALMVTLPSDIVFEPNSSILRPGTNVILDNLIADLRNYEGATIRISSYTDDLGEVKDNRNLSLARAQVVMQYLSRTLGDKYHWVAIGYGESHPLVENSSEANRQRNRRIEVAISP